MRDVRNFEQDLVERFLVYRQLLFEHFYFGRHCAHLLYENICIFAFFLQIGNLIGHTVALVTQFFEFDKNAAPKIIGRLERTDIEFRVSRLQCTLDIG